MMKLLAVTLCLMVAVASADKAVQVGPVWLKVKGQSGKVELGTNVGAKQKVTIDFDSMTEYAADGTTEVGKKASPKHAFSSFASQTFTFTPAVNTTYQGLKCVTFNFTSSLIGGKADLNIQTLLFMEKGYVITGGEEETEVKKGWLKFNVDLVGWPFCAVGGTDAAETKCMSSGNEEVGAFVDLEMEIKSKSKPSKEAKAAAKEACKAAGLSGKECKQPEKFSLGDGGQLALSTLVQKDGTWETMADGFPSVTVKGSKNIIALRFPKAATLSYDPTIDLGLPDEDNAAAPALAGAARAALLACVLALVAMLAF